MAEWRIPLRGDVVDLELLVEDLVDPMLAVLRDDHGFYLASSRFASEIDAGVVKNMGDELVARLNGVARATLQAHAAILCGGVARMRDDGKLDQWVFPESANAYARVGRPGLSINGVPVEPQRPSRAQRWLAIADTDEDAARVLRLLGRDLDWVALYKIVEIIKSACGGEDGVADRGWTSKSTLKRLMRTANSVPALGDQARHGSDPHEAPRDPMSIADARALSRRLAEQWLDSRA